MIRPLFAGSFTVVPEAAQVGWLARLYASARNWTRTLSTGWNVLKSEKSMFTKPGARRFPTKRETLPNVEVARLREHRGVEVFV